ncbi:MAG TPA: Asd/ArgC dimerization domain-containing protein, partial [Thermotogota bacterium]|nr:Asd/ArgC dimerization domain-containing protein [Thermotogota bacterium]
VVGRIRKDLAFDNGVSFWVVADQLLKGAAWNTIQIAQILVERVWGIRA